MPSPSLLLHAHPALGWWTLLWAVTVGGALLARRRVCDAAVAAWGLGALVAVSLAPPGGRLVPGLARTCDLGAAHLLWPWRWVSQDPRMGGVALMLVVGAAVCRRPAWLGAAAAVPVLVEVVQLAVPSLARACAVPDVVPLWAALAVGAGGGLLARTARRRLGVSVPRAVAVVVAVSVAAVPLAGWGLRSSGPVDPRTAVALLGGPAHDSARRGPGTEVPDPTGEGVLPGEGTPYEDLGRSAMADLRLLTGGTGDGLLPTAGPGESWGYFWPRDGAFMAVALARTGHVDQAVELLSLVGGLYLDPVHGFDARYLPSGERVTDDPRRAQGDGCGWVLWATHVTAALAPVPADVGDLRDRCTDQLLRATGGGAHLPAPGQDYWEQTTYEHLLGASAPVAAGLRFAAADYRALGEAGRADVVGAAADGVRSQIARSFGPDFLRAGTHGGLDAATAMLMPPFDPDPLPGVREAWLAYQEQALRPAGGLAPGTGWKQDGISWTPETALVAYTAAAAGEDELAEHWLGWLDEHRAPWGSLPEKVDWAGRPGGPAPLGWTAALVVLTLDEIDG